MIDRLSSTRLFRLVEVTAIAPFKHAKLLYNAAVSPLAAMGGIDNGMLLSTLTVRRFFFALLEENGHLLRLADQKGPPCPLNQAVYDLVVRLTAERARPSPLAWRQLAAA